MGTLYRSPLETTLRRNVGIVALYAGILLVSFLLGKAILLSVDRPRDCLIEIVQGNATTRLQGQAFYRDRFFICHYNPNGEKVNGQERV